jgi:hypothetical protein
MTTEFFNFHNDETFHFFKWVTESGLVDVDALISNAMQGVIAEAFVAPLEVDFSHAYRDALTYILTDLLESVAMGLGFSDSADFSWEIGNVQTPNARTLYPAKTEANIHTADSAALWQPLLRLAFKRVDRQAIAEALLIRAGKWAPDKELPEI